MGVSRFLYRAYALALLCTLSAGDCFADELPWITLTGADQASSDGFFDAVLNEQAQPLLATGSGSPYCVPVAPCVPGSPLMQPPIPPSVATPDSTPPEYSPQPANPETPPPAPPQQPAPVDFNQGFSSQTLLASRDVPVMFGDLFERLKAAESFSPLPTDRLYFNFSHFDNTPLIPGGLEAMRLTGGVEKTFFNGMMSIEARLPFLQTLDNNVTTNFGDVDLSATDDEEWQLGDVQLYLKGLLWEGSQGAISAGLGISLPTAPDTTYFDSDLFQTATFANDSIRLLPFISGIYRPNDRLFATTLLQFDFDTNGQGFSMTGSGTFPPGRYNQQQYLFLSQSVGYWIYDNGNFRLAPIAELHYNQTLNDADRLQSRTDNITVVNGVMGLTAMFNDQLSVSTAYVLPIGAGGADEQFDGEFRLLVNWYFGGL